MSQIDIELFFKRHFIATKLHAEFSTVMNSGNFASSVDQSIITTSIIARFTHL